MPDTECQKCQGTGRYSYHNSSMNMGGIALQAFTEGPCPGTKMRPDRSDCPFVEDNPYKQSDDT